MAFLLLLTLLAVVCALLRRSADRRPVLMNLEVASPSSLVTDHHRSFLAGIRSEALKLLRGHTARSDASTRFLFAVIILIHRYESPIGINRHDRMLGSILQSLWAIGRDLIVEAGNGIVSIKAKKTEEKKNLVHELQNELPLCQSKSETSPSNKAIGRQLTLSPINGVASIKETEEENTELTPSHEIVTMTESDMEIDDPLDETIGRQLILSPSLQVASSKPIQNEQSEKLAYELPSLQTPSVQIATMDQDDDQVIDMDIEEDLDVLATLSQPEVICNSNNGDASNIVCDINQVIDMEIDDLDDEVNPSIAQPVSQENMSLTNGPMMGTMAQARKKICKKNETKQMKKMKALEKEKERKLKEKLVMKEKKIVDAMKKRCAHFNERMKKARANRYLTNEELSSSKTHAFGFSKGFEAKFELIQEIGRGTFGMVYKARYKNNVICSSKLYVAVKTIEKSMLQGPGDIENVKIEVKMMETLNGKKNMIKFYGAYEDSKKAYLVMELCEGGNLGDFYNSRYGENQTRLVIKQILTVMRTCHGCNILHRDLKLQNFVLAVKGDLTSLRLIDFGIADFLLPGESLGGIGGSRGFIAPEVYDGRVGYESDCWSVGVIAYLLLAKKMPFPSPTNESDILAWRPDLSKEPDYSKETWRFAPSGAMQFVKGLLEPDPAKRFTVRQALRHEYLE